MMEGGFWDTNLFGYKIIVLDEFFIDCDGSVDANVDGCFKELIEKTRVKFAAVILRLKAVIQMYFGNCIQSHL